MSNNELQNVANELSLNGVAHLRQFVPTDEVELLLRRLESKDLRKQFKTRDRAGRVQEVEWLSRLDQVFRESQAYKLCSDFTSKMFKSPCHFGFDHAISKSPGSDPVHWHQDQFYSKLDQDKQCLSFWIPLQSVSPENGGMEYAVGKRKDLLPHVPVFLNSHVYHVKDLPTVSTVSPVMEVGDVCVHTPMTLHRSHPNQGASIRHAWILQFNRYGARRFFRLGNIRQHIRRRIT